MFQNPDVPKHFQKAPQKVSRSPMTCSSIVPRIRIRTFISLQSRLGRGGSAALAYRHGCTFRSFPFECFHSMSFIFYILSFLLYALLTSSRNDFTTLFTFFVFYFLEVCTYFIFNYGKNRKKDEDENVN